MSVGTGIECINLKKAKYNRDMRLAKAAESSHNTAVSRSVPADGATYNAERKSSYAGNGAATAHRTRAADIPADDGLTIKDITDALGKKATAAWHTYRRNKMIENARAPKYVTRTVKSKTAFPVSVIGYIVVFSVIAMFLVLGNSRINEATLYANSLESRINEAMNQCEILSAEVNSRNDAVSVENYALDVLGLVRKTDVAKTYVSISGEDKVVVSGNVSASSESRSPTTMTLDSGN